MPEIEKNHKLRIYGTKGDREYSLVMIADTYEGVFRYELLYKTTATLFPSIEICHDVISKIQTKFPTTKFKVVTVLD